MTKKEPEKRKTDELPKPNNFSGVDVDSESTPKIKKKIWNILWKMWDKNEKNGSIYNEFEDDIDFVIEKSIKLYKEDLKKVLDEIIKDSVKFEKGVDGSKVVDTFDAGYLEAISELRRRFENV